MNQRLVIAAVLASAVGYIPCERARASEPGAIPAVSTRAHAFYYGWFGTPEMDGNYSNWNHQVIDKSGRSFAGGDDIGANFFPEASCYSANDQKTLDRQMNELRSTGVGVIVASWWGRDSFTDKNLPRLMDAAAAHGLQVAIHIEPFGGRNARATRDAIVYLVDRHGEHAGWYRAPEFDNRPMFYVYDSYLTPAPEWAQVFTPAGENTLRKTKYDAVIIGLWVRPFDGRQLNSAGFDGYYTYFGCEGFTYGSTISNWPKLAAFGKQHQMLFIPSVAPGYLDTRIRPWNGRNTRPRNGGELFDRMFAAALDAPADWISITSYNEWHEGTQIEPAAPKKHGDFVYQDYSPEPPDFYLRRTRHWMDRLMARQAEK